MISWMSASQYINASILFISIACVPHSYIPHSYKQSTFQKSFYYNDSLNKDYIHRVPNSDMYTVQNQTPYIAKPANVINQDDNALLSTKSMVKEKYSNKKSFTKQKDKWHIIKKGETLYSLSKRYNVTIDEICKANNIKSSSSIQVGQRILIPSTEISTTSLHKAYILPQANKEPAPSFSCIWPVSSVIAYSSDQMKGGRPLGILITTTPKSKVVASADGKVVKVGFMRGFGNFIVIQHQKEFYTIYSLLDAILVKEGQIVKRGTSIGFIGDSNSALHFQINHSGQPLDPLHFLAHR